MSSGFAKALSTRLCPFGLIVNAVPVTREMQEFKSNLLVEDSDFHSYELRISGKVQSGAVASCLINLSFPKFDKTGSYEIAGVWRTVCHRAILDYTQELGDKNRKYKFLGKFDVIIEAVHKILHRSLNEFFYTGTSPHPDCAQGQVDAWFKTSPLCQVIGDSNVAKSSKHEMVYFSQAIGGGLDMNKRTFSEYYWGLLDPCSTSSSDNVNMVFRLCKGVKLENGDLIKPLDEDISWFCTAVEDNVIGVQYGPKRLHMLRSQFEQSLELVNPEDPYVQGPNHSLSGVHLQTAIMHLGHHTFEDAIAISQTAANKLACYRRYKVTVATKSDVEVLVKKGEKVGPNTPIFKHEDRSGATKISKCKKLRDIGTIEELKCFRTTQFGSEMLRYQAIVVAKYPVQPGDKLTTRGAIKGVATVVPDDKMPRFDRASVPVDCCIAPESIYNRQSMVTFWEMMMNKMQKQKGASPVVSLPYEEEFSFQDLCDLNYQRKRNLYYKDRELTEETFVAPLYFMRLDKIASEVISHQDGKLHLNIQGLPIDNASISGQRCDLATRINLSCKGLKNTLDSMIEDSHGTDLVREIIGVIKNE